MESEEVMNGGIKNGGGVVSYEDRPEKEYNEVASADKVKGTLAEEVLENWEEYWDDVSDRLVISRVVSDSVVKGMVSAVEQEAAERIAAKELEVVILKERLQSHEVGYGNCNGVHVLQKAYEIRNSEIFPCSTNPCKKHEKMREDLNFLRNLARDQIKKVNKEIEFAKGSNAFKRVSSNSELVGLSGILHEKQPESWVYVNKLLDSLKITLHTVCRKVDDLLVSSNNSSCESQQNLGSLATVEDVGVQTENCTLQNESAQNLLEPDAQNLNWLEKFNELSSLGTKLEAIMKSLSKSETELVSQGSRDFEQLHHKAFRENGRDDPSSVHVVESYGVHDLKHMKKEELVDYFNDIITRMKRDHESALHRNTEEYFRLKREFLKEKGYSMTHRKDEEFDALRKKIPVIISKLEDFLLENEKFPALTSKLENMETLLSDNSYLKDCLVEKENEVKVLEMQVSQTAMALSLVGNLEAAIEDSSIDFALNQDIFRCALREQIAAHLNPELPMKMEVYDTTLPETSNRYEIDDEKRHSLEKEKLKEEILSLKTIVEQKEKLVKDLSQDLIQSKKLESEQLSLVTESNEDLDSLRTQYLEAQKHIEVQNLQLDMTKLMAEEAERESEKASALVKQENDKLLLSEAREQKIRKEMEMAASRFSKISEDFGVLNQQLDETRTMLAEANRERENALSSVQQTQDKLKLSEDRAQTLSEELEMVASKSSKLSKDFEELNLQFVQSKTVLAETIRERDNASIYVKQMQAKLQSCEFGQLTLRKEMEIASSGFFKIYEDFECRVAGAIKSISLRLENTRSNLKDLTEIATVLGKKRLMYKSKLQRKCTDLAMAESEVDLLGDEVDALLKLLGNIYIALDHYFPVLKHYPGIIESLTLVKRHLTGETTIQSDRLHD